MSNPWFRMYTDFLRDPKILSLAFEDQRHFIAVLALKCDGTLDNGASGQMLDRMVAQLIWADHSAITEIKRRLVEARLIDRNWQPLAWEKRQYKSDTSVERTRKWRETKQKKVGDGDVTSQRRHVRRHGDGVDTDTDTDTDTDKEPERKPRKRAVEVVYPTWLDREAWAGYRELRTKLKKPLTVKAEQINLVELEKLAPGGRGHVEIIEQSIARGWQSFYPLKPAQQQITTARTTVPAEESMHPALVADRERRGLKRFGA
jgi:hypothetical protein